MTSASRIVEIITRRCACEPEELGEQWLDFALVVGKVIDGDTTTETLGELMRAVMSLP